MVKYSISLRDLPRAQAIVHRISRFESQYRHSHLPNNGSAATIAKIEIQMSKLRAMP